MEVLIDPRKDQEYIYRTKKLNMNHIRKNLKYIDSSNDFIVFVRSINQLFNHFYRCTHRSSLVNIYLIGFIVNVRKRN